MLRLPANRPTALPFGSFGRTTPCVCVRSSTQARRQPGARSFTVWQPPRQLVRDGVAGSPRFLGNPYVPTPCSSTPAGPATPCRDGVVDAAPVLSKTKAPAGYTLGAQSHGLGTGCLRFAAGIAPGPRKTRFRLLARLYPVGLETHRVATKGFRWLILLSQASPGAMTVYLTSYTD
jgi:hypothetical protein